MPGAQVSPNTFFLSIDGDSGQTGVVNYIKNIGGVPFGSNGTITIVNLQGNNCPGRIYSAGTTVVFTNSIAMGFGAETFLVTGSTQPGMLFEGQDLDQNDDGQLDASFGLNPIDGFSWIISSQFNKAYAPIIFEADATSGSTDVPDAATRFLGDSSPNNVASWFWGEIVGSESSTQYGPPLSPNAPQ